MGKLNTESKFRMGQIVMTRGFCSFFPDQQTASEVAQIFLHAHVTQDLAMVNEASVKENKGFIKNGDAILSPILDPNGFFPEPVWVWTEWDRSVTTVMFRSER